MINNVLEAILQNLLCAAKDGAEYWGSLSPVLVLQQQLTSFSAEQAH